MTRCPPRSLLITAAFVVALMAAPGIAQAIVWCQHWFPFGVINGKQMARFSAALSPPPDSIMSCPASLAFPVSLAFFDRQGVMVGDLTERMLRQGMIVHADFIGNPDTRTGLRLEIQAEAMVGDPAELPPDPFRTQVLFSVEVFDRGDMKTQYIMTDKATLDIAGRS